jgi:hypothetical protein
MTFAVDGRNEPIDDGLCRSRPPTGPARADSHRLHPPGLRALRLRPRLRGERRRVARGLSGRRHRGGSPARGPDSAAFGAPCEPLRHRAAVRPAAQDPRQDRGDRAGLAPAGRAAGRAAAPQLRSRLHQHLGDHRLRARDAPRFLQRPVAYPRDPGGQEPRGVPRAGARQQGAADLQLAGDARGLRAAGRPGGPHHLQRRPGTAGMAAERLRRAPRPAAWRRRCAGESRPASSAAPSRTPVPRRRCARPWPRWACRRS